MLFYPAFQIKTDIFFIINLIFRHLQFRKTKPGLNKNRHLRKSAKSPVYNSLIIGLLQFQEKTVFPVFSQIIPPKIQNHTFANFSPIKKSGIFLRKHLISTYILKTKSSQIYFLTINYRNFFKTATKTTLIDNLGITIHTDRIIYHSILTYLYRI